MKYSDEKIFLKLVGERIKQKRLQQNLTQLDLAIKSGIEENALQRIEKGRINSTLKTVLKIINGLNIDASELFDFYIKTENGKLKKLKIKN